MEGIKMKKTIEELKNDALEMIKDNEELFVELVNELDAWDGFADGYRAYPMYELDELFGDTKLTEFLDKLAPDFNFHDEYLTDTIYGVSSTDNIYEWYSSNISEEEVLENVIENFNNIYIDNDEFKEVVEKIVNYENETE
jgi:hypothetical protein